MNNLYRANIGMQISFNTVQRRKIAKKRFKRCPCHTKTERSKIQMKAALSSSTILPKDVPLHQNTNTAEQRGATRAVRNSTWDINVDF